MNPKNRKAMFAKSKNEWWSNLSHKQQITILHPNNIPYTNQVDPLIRRDNEYKKYLKQQRG
jgi:hypothetical protein